MRILFHSINKFFKIFQVVVTPRVREEVRRHYNCQELSGAELEDQGEEGTALTHWEKRLFEVNIKAIPVAMVQNQGELNKVAHFPTLCGCKVQILKGGKSGIVEKRRMQIAKWLPSPHKRSKEEGRVAIGGCQRGQRKRAELPSRFCIIFSHFFFAQNEAMTGTHTQNPIYSRVTLALMEDTGWYLPNYELADDLSWGKHLGCDFALK